MAATESSVPVGSTGKNLETTQVTTSQGVVEREVVSVADPEDPSARQAVKNADPGAADYGAVVRIVGAVPASTGAATSALQTTGNTSLSSIDTKTPALTAGRVPVDGSGVTQPISAAVLPLPTGASTSALQTTGNTSLSNLDTNAGAQADAAVVTDTTGTLSGKLRGLIKWAFERMPTSLGQKAMAASLPVVLASDQATFSVKVTDSEGSSILTSAHGRLTVGMESFELYDPIDGTTVNPILWQFDASTFAAPSQANGFISLNSAGSTASGYSRIVSRRSLGVFGHFPLYVHVMGLATNLPVTANAQFLEFGLQITPASNAAPTDGAYFRLFHDGTAVRLIGVTVNSVTGAEQVTSSTTFTAPTAGSRFTWIIVLDHSSIQFRVGSTVATLSIQSTVATPFSSARINFAAKERNTGAVGTAISGKVSEVSISLRDAHNPKDWPSQMAVAMGRGGYLNAATFAASAFFPANNSALPTAQTVSNTAAPATFGSSQGGFFNVTCPTPSASTDNIIFGFQVPAGLTYMMQGFEFRNPWVGTLLGATALKIDFYLAVNSTAVSLATAEAAGSALARRGVDYIGRYQAAASSAADTFLNGQGPGTATSLKDVCYSFPSAIPIEGGQFIHLYAKFLTGPTTGSVIGFFRPLGYTQ